MSQYADELAKSLLQELEGETDEDIIATISQSFIQAISGKFPNLNSRKKPIAVLRAAVKEKYPSTETHENPWQYPTTSGQRKQDADGNFIPNPERWEHLALKYLTLDPDEWKALKAGQKEIETPALIVEEIKPEQTPTEDKKPKRQTKTTPKQKTAKPKPPIKDLLNQLPFDEESLTIVKEAIALSNLSPTDFITQATLTQARIQTKIEVGKTQKQNQDLTTIPTEELLKSAYKLHPTRTEELTRRAVRAICIYNDEIATEPQQRWFIGMLSIRALIVGSQPRIREAMRNMEVAIADHNAKYNLNQYHNRKKVDIADVIDICKLVPDGSV
jgi:ribosomal protein S7